MREIRVGAQRVPARVAETCWQRTRGFRGRISPPEYALVFPFDDAKPRTVDMLGVGFPIDAAFVVGGEATAVERLNPWVGVARERFDTLVEIPVGVCPVTDGMEVDYDR